MKTSCSYCNGTIQFWRKKNDYEIFACDTCGAGQVTPTITLEKVKEIYSNSGHDGIDEIRNDVTLQNVIDNENNYPNSTLDAKRIVENSSILNKISSKSVLDIGSGYGFFAREYLQNGYKVEAIDLAALDAKIFEEMNGIKPIAFTFEDYSSKEKFSHILMSQILEHVIDPADWLRRSNNLLLDDGLLVIAVPHFNSLFRLLMQEKEPYIIPPYHLNYFTRKALTTLLEAKGFEVVKFETVSRLPFKKFVKKLHIPTFLTPVVSGIGNVCLWIIDSLNRGTSINIYARKTKNI